MAVEVESDMSVEALRTQTGSMFGKSVAALVSQDGRILNNRSGRLKDYNLANGCMLTAVVGGRLISREEVAQHCTESDCWLVLRLEGSLKVVDVTEFLRDHPAGPTMLIEHAGKDASLEFDAVFHSPGARIRAAKMVVGELRQDSIPEYDAVRFSRLEYNPLPFTVPISLSKLFGVTLLVVCSLFRWMSSWVKISPSET